jgi:putative protease
LNIELLAPAPNLACGIEAINHGADAVYIGGPRFGARAAAANSVEDIRSLCSYAHIFGARVYVAMNTILYDDELAEAERLIGAVYDAGADALIIQDMGITRLRIPPIALHASTQVDNSTVEQARLLESEGFSQMVLARELSLEEIREIASCTSLRLEAFVHGALCASLSGRCYISADKCRRSANRGECAQYCRLPWTWTDSKGRIIARNQHLLSLKDLNRSDDLEAMIDSGVSSFKIEGRLKGMSYVKNITAWYRLLIDGILSRRTDLSRASRGRVSLGFEPHPDRSFNRGFTPYFLRQRPADPSAPLTPKFVGMPAGIVKEVRAGCIIVKNNPSLNNGDGLVFFNDSNCLEGFRINRAEGSVVYPRQMPRIRRGAKLYRNRDQEWEAMLARPSASRKLSVDVTLTETVDGYSLCISLADDPSLRAEAHLASPQKAVALSDPGPNIRLQLSRLGDSPFEAGSVQIITEGPRFLPSSALGKLRRQAVEQLLCAIRAAYVRPNRIPSLSPVHPCPIDIPASFNVSNREARSFYAERGAVNIQPAFEIASPRPDLPLMLVKHCLRYERGWCPRVHRQASPFAEPFFLSSGAVRLRIEFDCDNCRMALY